jgi:hypothetical protein
LLTCNSTCGILFLGPFGVPSGMVHFNKTGWEIAGGIASLAIVGGAIAWLMLRKRPSEEEVERMRRRHLVQVGRIVDGMLLDICELDAPPTRGRGSKHAPGDAEPHGRKLTLLLFSYRIGGVDYECSQDITDLRTVVDVAEIRVGFPCSVRYQPGNPQNSIVLSEGWSGLRSSLPQIPVFEDPERSESGDLTGHLRRTDHSSPIIDH